MKDFFCFQFVLFCGTLGGEGVIDWGRVGMVVPRGVWQTGERVGLGLGSLGGIVALDGGGWRWLHLM